MSTEDREVIDAGAPPVLPPTPPAPRARSRPKRPPIRLKVDRRPAEPPEPVSGRRLAISWGASVALYGLLILALALHGIAPKPPGRDRTISTALTESGPVGDELALESIEPLELEALPVAADSLAQPAAGLAAPELDLDARASLAPSRGAGGEPPAALDAAGDGDGDGDGFGPPAFGAGGEVIRGHQVKVGDPQFTLIWDTDADLDLHVLEPGGDARPDDEENPYHIYWRHPNGAQGGELDVDDQDGFGPENVYWVQGRGPAGDYKWYVRYFAQFNGRPMPTRWKVRIKHNGQLTIVRGRLNTFGQHSRIYTLHNDPAPESSPDDVQAVRGLDAP